MISGVLSTTYREATTCWALEVEFYAYSGLGLEGTPGYAGGTPARVEQMVIRLETMVLEARDPAYINRVAAIEDHIHAIPRLRTVTLETIKAKDSAELAEKLPKLRASGKLHRRTCKEAKAIAQEALRSPAGDGEIQGVLSPLWVSDDEYQDECWWWCVKLSSLLTLLIDIYLIASLCRLKCSDEERKRLQNQIAEARRKAAEAQATAAQGDEKAAPAHIDGSSNLGQAPSPVADSEVVQ